jgi:hypothetical protein
MLMKLTPGVDCSIRQSESNSKYWHDQHRFFKRTVIINFKLTLRDKSLLLILTDMKVVNFRFHKYINCH